MVCVDTDFLIALDRHEEKAIEKMSALAEGDEFVHTTIISAAEFYAGIFASNRKTSIENARVFLKQFSILLLDEDSSLLWARLRHDLRSNTIGERDLFIASIALAKGHALVTRNIKHFARVPDLTVDSW